MKKIFKVLAIFSLGIIIAPNLTSCNGDPTPYFGTYNLIDADANPSIDNPTNVIVSFESNIVFNEDMTFTWYFKLLTGIYSETYNHSGTWSVSRFNQLRVDFEYENEKYYDIFYPGDEDKLTYYIDDEEKQMHYDYVLHFEKQ